MADDVAANGDEWQYEDADQPDLAYSIVRPGDVAGVAEFLIEHFFTNEPLGHALKLDAGREVRPWLPRMVAHVIQENMSIVVRDTTRPANNDIVAVCLNDVDRLDQQRDPDNVTIFSFVDRHEHPAMWKITRVLEELVVNRDVFDAYNVRSYVGIQMLSVSPRLGGRGLAKKLVQLTETLARSKNYPLLLSEATSEFSARAFKRAGFESNNTLQYDTFTLDNETPFKSLADEQVHTCAQLMIKCLL